MIFRRSTDPLSIAAHNTVCDKAKLFIQSSRGDIVRVDRQVDLHDRARNEHPVHACCEQVGANAAAARSRVCADEIHVSGLRCRFDLAEEIAKQAVLFHGDKELMSSINFLGHLPGGEISIGEQGFVQLLNLLKQLFAVRNDLSLSTCLRSVILAFECQDCVFRYHRESMPGSEALNVSILHVTEQIVIADIHRDER